MEVGKKAYRRQLKNGVRKEVKKNDKKGKV